MNTVPKGYKQTKIDVIPDGWQKIALGDAVTFQRGFDLPSQFRRTGHVPVVSSAGVTDYHNASIVEPPGVVTGRYGTIGDVFLIKEPFWPLNTTLFVRNFHGNDPCFIYYSLQQFDFTAFSGKSGVPGVNRNDLHGEWISIPRNIDEQRAIAEALSDVDELLSALDRLIAKKREIKQAAMQQLLTGQTRLPGFSGEWKCMNMADNSTLKARIGWQGLTTAEYLKNGDYFLVTGTDFSDGRVAWSSCCYVAAERYTQDRNIQVRPNDILLTKDGTIGKVAFVESLPCPATLNSGVFVIRPKDESYDPRFFYYVLASRMFETFLAKLQAGSTISHLYQKDFVFFSFFAPPTLSEQTAIAEVLSDMDAELAALEQRRDKTRLLKQGMMQELLTGRIRLITSGSEERQS